MPQRIKEDSSKSIISTGHAEIEVTMRSDTLAGGRTETANFIVQVEPNAIDDCVMQLRVMQVRVGAVAELRAST